MQNIPADVKAKLASSSGKIANKTHIIDFLFGGRAKFTLKSLKTGRGVQFYCKQKVHYTAVHHPDSGYLGAITKVKGDEIQFKPIHNPYNKHSPEGIFAWFCRHYTEYDKIELWHHGECSMCGRALTDPKSIERGIGPVCYEALSRGELPF